MENKELTFSDLIAFVDANRNTVDPNALIMLPGYNDTGIVSCVSITPFVCQLNPECQMDGEVVRKRLVKRLSADKINAIYFNHDSVSPIEDLI